MKKSIPNKLFKQSITQIFIAFSVVIFCGIISIYLSWLWKSYHKDSIEILQKHALKIERVFISDMEYTAYLMDYIGSRISKNGNFRNLRYIDNLLSSVRLNPEVNDSTPWNMFSWIDIKSRLVVNSDKGIVPAIDVSDRKYAKLSKEETGKMHLDNLTFGKVSGHAIIPAGMGVVDKRNRYLGTIVFGIQINKLSQKIANSLDSDKIDFAIFDLNLNPILKSQNFLEDKKLSKAITNLDLSISDPAILTDPDLFDRNTSFSYYQKIDNYPYFIIVKYNEVELWQGLLRIIVEKSLSLLILFLILLVIYLFIKKSIIDPVSQLSLIVDKLANDKDENIDFPKSKVKEISNLSNQLKQIRSYKVNLMLARSAQSRFFANISHELRTPLNGMINATALVRNEFCGPVNKQQLEMLTEVYGASNQLYHIISNIIDISKIDSGTMDISKDDIDIREVVSKVVNILKLDCDNFAVNIEVDFDDKIPTSISADHNMIYNVIFNVISNAVKFSRENGEVLISCYVNDDDNLEVSVQNFGEPIKSEFTKSDFDFHHLSDGYSRAEKQGVGIGLVVAKKMAMINNAKLFINSVLGEGTIVKVVFFKQCLNFTKSK